MERDNKIINSMLSVMPNGSYKCGWLFKGWIHVQNKDNHRTVSWTSHKDSHNAINGQCVYVDFYSNRIDDVCIPTLSLHNERDKGMWLAHAQYLEDKVWCAFKRNNLDKVGR